MPIDVGVDRADFAERRLVQLLEDLELDARLRLEAIHGLGERADDRRGRQRVGRGVEIGALHQVPDPPVQRNQLFMTVILDDAHDVADQHRFVERVEVDQRELRRVHLGEIRFLVCLAGDAVLDMRAQALLEIGHQGGAVDLERLPRLEKQLLLVAHVGFTGALHQHVAYAIEQGGEGKQQPVNGEVAAVGEDFRQLPGDGAARRRNVGRHVWRHGLKRRGGNITCDQCATSGINGLACFFGELTLARGRIVCHWRGGSTVPRKLGPRFFDTLERDRDRRPELLCKQRHAQFLELPAKRFQIG